MKIEDAIKLAIDGRGLLFTGAGFSCGAENYSKKPVPSGKKLAQELIAAIGIKGEADLNRASTAFLQKRTTDDLVKLLKDRFSVKKITESHKIIASLKWMHVYTTNYDSVYEIAKKELSKQFKTVTAKERPDGLVNRQDLVIHINGSIESLSKDELFTSFKLTSSSYAAESFEDSGWAFHFRNDVRNAAVIIFVGYSLYDLDIARVLRAENVMNKAFFIVAPPDPENELEALELQSVGQVHRIGVDDFARLVEEIKRNYTPVIAPIILDAWEKITPVSSTKTPTDLDVISFLTEGVLGDKMRTQLNSATSSEYLIPRQFVQQIKEALLDNKKHVILHGVLGCGKSLIVEAFGLLAYGAGWNVFALRSDDKNAGELQQILKSTKNVVLIIESYHRHMRLVKWIVEAKIDNVILLLTDRTDVHEIFSSELFQLLKTSCIEVDCSKLTDSEITDVSSLFDRYGLWGTRQSSSPELKTAYIKGKCAQELPSLLVDVLKSKHITEKYAEIVSSSSNPREIQSLLIGMFALEVMNYEPKIYYIQELLGGKNIRWSYIKTYQGLTSIIDFASHAVRTRSAVLGLHLLHTLFTPKLLVEILTLIAKEADERSRDYEFRGILKDLMRFKHVALILPEYQRLQTTIAFYENIKNLQLTKSDPQFWLQYGIACLTLDQIDRAEKYFEDAYSFARGISGYDCYQIDNHYARFLLAKALLQSSKDDAMTFLEKARTIVLAQMQKEVDRHYPFRAALGIFKVHSKWSREWSLTQIKTFNGIFTEIEKRCDGANPMIRNNRYVVECSKLVKEKLSSAGIMKNISDK